MSRYPIRTAEADRLIRSLTEQLVTDAGKTPASRLSPVEERILSIAKYLFLDCVIAVRCSRIEQTGEAIDRVPVTEAIAAEGARIALTAAIELEAPLREIRDRMEVRR